MKKKIFVLSDGTGETAQVMIKAALIQFTQENVSLIRYNNIRNKNQIETICEKASQEKALIIYTLVSPELRLLFYKKSKKKSFFSIDLLGPLLLGLGNYFQNKPKEIAGLLHHIDENYFNRINAIEYSISHDDGKDFSDIDQAHLILIGISRTSKTPLSLYLSYQGWKVINIPIILNIPLPKIIDLIPSKKIIALTIEPDTLFKIRQNRIEKLGQKKKGDYTDKKKIFEEIEYANEIFKKNRQWPVFNVTGKALEEIASDIIQLMTARNMIP